MALNSMVVGKKVGFIMVVNKMPVYERVLDEMALN
jgi:hypothetical protein